MKLEEWAFQTLIIQRKHLLSLETPILENYCHTQLRNNPKFMAVQTELQFQPKEEYLQIYSYS